MRVSKEYSSLTIPRSRAKSKAAYATPGSSASTSLWLKTRSVPRLTPRVGRSSPEPTSPPSSQAAASRTRATSSESHLAVFITRR